MLSDALAALAPEELLQRQFRQSCATAAGGPFLDLFRNLLRIFACLQTIVSVESHDKDVMGMLSLAVSMSIFKEFPRTR